MIGTGNQIDWAVQIKAQVDAEFYRVRKVLESVATKQSRTMEQIFRPSVESSKINARK